MVAPANFFVRIFDLVVLTVLLQFMVSLSAQGQDQKLAEESLTNDHLEWFKGSIILNDGTILEGLVKYNDKIGIIAFEDAHESTVFTPRSLTSFEFYDEVYGMLRKFLSLEYSDPKTGALRPLIFEIAREFNTFAVLTKTDPVEVDVKRSWRMSGTYPVHSGGYQYNRLSVEQTETVYVLDQSGRIEPYIKVVNQEVNGAFARSVTKNKIVNDNALEK